MAEIQARLNSFSVVGAAAKHVEQEQRPEGLGIIWKEPGPSNLSCRDMRVCDCLGWVFELLWAGEPQGSREGDGSGGEGRMEMRTDCFLGDGGL